MCREGHACLSLLGTSTGRPETLALALQIKVLCNGIVDTLGRVTFGGRVNHPFTAHPKVDPVTGEAISQASPAQLAHQTLTRLLVSQRMDAAAISSHWSPNWSQG